MHKHNNHDPQVAFCQAQKRGPCLLIQLWRYQCTLLSRREKVRGGFAIAAAKRSRETGHLGGVVCSDTNL